MTERRPQVVPEAPLGLGRDARQQDGYVFGGTVGVGEARPICHAGDLTMPVTAGIEEMAARGVRRGPARVRHALVGIRPPERLRRDAHNRGERADSRPTLHGAMRASDLSRPLFLPEFPSRPRTEMPLSLRTKALGSSHRRLNESRN